MRIAVYCTGFLRSFKANIQSLKEWLSEAEKCVDLFFYVVSNEFECDSYYNSKTSFEDIQTELKPKLFILEKEKKVQTVAERIRSMWYKLKVVDQHRREIEQREKINYDIIVRIRPDMFFSADATFYYPTNGIAIPANDPISYPEERLDGLEGINDQFAAGSSEAMRVYCGLYDSIEEYNRNGFRNSSSMLKHHLQKNNIPVCLLEPFYKLVQNENKVVTIAGDSGSGKTTFAHMLKSCLQERNKEALIFECDRYHKWERGDERWKTFTHLHPEANNIHDCKRDIFSLKSGIEIMQRDYDHSNGKFTELEPIKPAPIIIVIGLHTLFNAELNKVSDCKIFIDPCSSVKEQWKIDRDKIERGYTEEQIKSQIQKRKPDYEEYIQPQINSADYVVRVSQDEKCIVSDKVLKKEFKFITIKEVCEFIITRL